MRAHLRSRSISRIAGRGAKKWGGNRVFFSTLKNAILMRCCVQKAIRFPFVFVAVLFLAAASTTSLTVEAQQQSDFVRLDKVSASRATTNGLEIHSGGAIMQIIALRDDVLRIRVGPGGALPEDASWAVLPSSRTSAIAVTPESTSTSVGFKTDKLHIAVQKDPLDLTVTDMEGHVVVAQLPGRPIEYLPRPSLRRRPPSGRVR